MIVFLFVGAILFAAIFMPDSDEEEPALSGTVHDYKVVHEEDASVPLRTRGEWHILATTANNFDDRAATVIEAARRLQKESGKDFVRVWLVQSPHTVNSGQQIAKADYSPDGKGVSALGGGTGNVWEVESCRGALTDDELKHLDMWYEAREAAYKSITPGFTGDIDALIEKEFRKRNSTLSEEVVKGIKSTVVELMLGGRMKREMYPYP